MSYALVDFHFSRRGYADPCGLDIEHLKQFVIVLIKQDGRAGGGSQLHRAADVVDVRMGDHDLFYLQAMLVYQREHALDFVARIDDHGFMGDLVSDNGAVTLQRADRKNLVDHGRLP
jgi:hypothetical protein